jgi:hypothetical protein
MWLFTTDGFMSVVSKDCEPHQLLVRARVRGDIERAFPGAKVTETRKADYRYRTVVAREALVAYLTRQARDLDYENFKDTVTDQERHDAYLQVWSAMHRMQEKLR